MADVVVVGAGIGGLAVSARLAKAGHRVTVCERNPFPGGAVRSLCQDGFRWDAGASSLTLPATVRDLFRKSGRPLERYVDLELRTPARRHVFTDGSEIDLPTGSRGAQTRAVEAGMGKNAAQAWTAFVDAQAAVWDVLRREVLDLDNGGARLASWRVARRLQSRRTLADVLGSALDDDRLRDMATYPVLLAGSTPDTVMGFAAVQAYVERSSGVWSIPGAGMGALTDALVTRMNERGVAMRYQTPVTRICVADGAVTGVEAADGELLPAEVVVTDVDPRSVFGEMLPASSRTRRASSAFSVAEPAQSVSGVHLGLRSRAGTLPGDRQADRPEEIVLHGSPLLVVNTGGSAPPDHQAWTVWARDLGAAQVLDVLANRGLDVRDRVVCRIDRSPDEIMAETGGSPFGFADSRYRASVRRAKAASGVAGLHLLGAGVHPGPSIPYVVWGAAHVADVVGRAER